MGATLCQLEDCVLSLVCRLRLLVLLELRVRLIVHNVCQARSERLFTRHQLLQNGHDCWVCCCDGRGGSHAVALKGDLHRGDCSVPSHLSHVGMPVSLADWPARVGVPVLKSRSIVMGTLLDSFQSYGATRSRSPVPQEAVSGKRDSSSVAAVWLSYFLVSRRSTKMCVLNENPFHASTNATLLREVTYLCRTNNQLEDNRGVLHYTVVPKRPIVDEKPKGLETFLRVIHMGRR